MKITITAIDPDEAVLIPGTSALGWRGKFGCPLVIGDAIFVPARAQEHNLRVGNSITAETSFDEVEGIGIIHDTTPDSFVALPTSGDYEITGTITHAVPQGNVSVSVRGLNFILDRKDLGTLAPEAGQHLRFSVRRLVFWDTGT